MIRLLTYNIHKAIGNDRKYFLKRIIEILKESNADIICLQEVDFLVPRSHNEHSAEKIAEELGYYYELGLNVYLKKGAYGNATLSKYPILFSENMNLTWGIKKRRGCLITKIQIPPQLFYGKKIRLSQKIDTYILNIHLGLVNFERIWQIQKLLSNSYLDSVKKEPIIIAGDTNDSGSKLDFILNKNEFFDTAILYRTHYKIKKNEFNTFPSYTPKPLVRLDKAFINQRWIVKNHYVLKNKLTKIASDHYPVIIELIGK